MTYSRFLLSLSVFIHNVASAGTPVEWGLPQDAAARTVPGLSISAQRLLFSGINSAAGAVGNNGVKMPPVPAGAAYIEASSISPQYSVTARQFNAKLAAERNRYIGTQRDTDDLQDLLKSGALVSASVAVATTWTGIGAVGSAATTAGLLVADTLVHYYSKESSQQYTNKVAILYAHAWADLDKTDPVTSKTARLNITSPDSSKQQAALRTLLGHKATIFSGTGVATLTPQELNASQPYLVEALKQGLANERLLSQGELITVKAKIRDLDLAIEDFRNDVTGRMSRLQGGLESTKKTIDLLDSRVSALDSSLKTTNVVLFYKLTPQEQINALNHGFELGLDEKQKKELLGQLDIEVAKKERTNAIEALHATTQEALGVASAVITLARATGVVIPVEVDKAIQIGREAATVISAFALGPAGGVMALAGAIGAFQPGAGSGPDPTIMKSLADIREKLTVVIELQKEALEKLDRLDVKLSAQHRQVMATLLRIDQKVDTLIDIAFDDRSSELQSCQDFSQRLSNAVTGQPTRASYDVIREAFNATPIIRADYSRCTNVLQEMTRIGNSKVHWYLRNRPSQAVEGVSNARSPTHTYFYRPAYEFTMRELNISNDEQCARRMLTEWTQRPSTFATYDPAAHQCDVLRAKNIHEFQSHLGETQLKPSILLADYLNYDAYIDGSSEQLLPTLVRHQITIAPFYEIKNANKLLPDISNIRPTPAGVPPPGLDAMSAILDIISIADAQETILSGAPTAHRIVAYLSQYMKEGAFGFNPNGAGSPPPPVTAQTAVGSESDLFWEHCNIAKTPKLESAHIICLLERNPQMLANALAYWMHLSLAEPKAKGAAPTRYLTYETAFTLRQLPFMATAVPDFTWREDAEGVYGFVLRSRENVFRPADFAKEATTPEPGWYFKMNRLDKSTWYTPLPGMWETKMRPIRYRPAAQMLSLARQLALQEYDRYSAIQSSTTIPSEMQRFISVLSLQEAQMSARASRGQ